MPRSPKESPPILHHRFRLNILSTILGILPPTTVTNSSPWTGNGDFSDLLYFLILLSPPSLFLLGLLRIKPNISLIKSLLKVGFDHKITLENKTVTPEEKLTTQPPRFQLRVIHIIQYIDSRWTQFRTVAANLKYPRTHLGRYRVTVIILSFSVTLWNVLPILNQYWSSSSGRFRDTRPNRKKKSFPPPGNGQLLLFHTDSEKET